MHLNKREIIDISPKIHSGLAVFPGDTQFEQKFLQEMTGSSNYSLSFFKTTTHIGAHADAPSHYKAGGQSIDEINLSPYIGTAQVIECKKAVSLRLQVEEIAAQKITAQRILFKTGSYPNPDVWSNDFFGLSQKLVEFLAAKGVVLIGIDTPSVDPAQDKILESHNAIARANIRVLEGLDLRHVPAGDYDLVALPLKISGAEASPVRAILLR